MKPARTARSRAGERRSRTPSIARELLQGLGVVLGLAMLLRHQHSFEATPERLALFAVYGLSAVPLFLALRRALGAMRPLEGPCLLLLGLTTALTAPILFARMSRAPAYLLAMVLVFHGARMLGGPEGRERRAGWIFPSLLAGTTASQACALY